MRRGLNGDAEEGAPDTDEAPEGWRDVDVMASEFESHWVRSAKAFALQLVPALRPMQRAIL